MTTLDAADGPTPDPQRAFGDLLLDELFGASWAQRKVLLERLDRTEPSLRARTLLRLLSEAGDLGAAPPNNETRAQRARLESELGWLFLRSGRLDLAEALFDRAQRTATESVDETRVLTTLGVGMIQLRRRDAQGAGATLQAAADLAHSAGLSLLEAQAEDGLGRMHLDRLELAAAESHLERSLRLKMDSDDLEGQAISYGNLGRVAYLRGEYSIALDYFRRDQQIASQTDNPHGQAIMANQIGLVWLQCGELDKADAAVRAGVAFARSSPSPLDRLYSARMLGRIAIARGELESAARHLADAREGFTARSALETARCDVLLAVTRRMLGHRDDAHRLLDEARAVFVQVRASGDEARVCLELAQTAAGEDERDKALAEGLTIAARLPRTAVRAELVGMHSHIQAAQLVAHAGFLEPGEVESLLDESYRGSRGLGDVLVADGFISRSGFEEFLSTVLGIPFLKVFDPDEQGVREALRALGPALAQRLAVIPVELVEGALVVGVGDPLDFGLLNRLELITGLTVEAHYAAPETLSVALELLLRQTSLGLGDMDTPAAAEKLVRYSIESGASAIHLQPQRGETVVRLRIDGVLHEVDRLLGERGRQLTHRFKAVAGLEPNDGRTPRDGRVRFEVGPVALWVRVAAFPSTHGDALVLRFARSAGDAGLGQLGFDPGTVNRLGEVARRREGLLLISGPAGSGRSSTLTALVRLLDPSVRAVVRIEDPIEYELTGVTHSELDGVAGFDVRAALRAVVLQDPDVVVLDALDDPETAQRAAGIAATGRLVIGTVHAPDSVGAVTLLGRLGVPAWTLSASLVGVLAQRLIRRLCPSCRREVPLDPGWVQEMSSREANIDVLLENAAVFGPVGCDKCRHTGYAGRVPVYELLELDGELAGALMADASEAELRTLAKERGLRSLSEAALRRVLAGETSQAEVRSVLRALPW